jgi:hypothetical protein
MTGLLVISVLAALVVASTAGAANPSSLTLESKSVANGSTFTVTLTAATTPPTAGGQAYITFDQTKLTCNSATYNTATPYFGPDEYNVSVTIANGKINNSTGNINGITSTTGGPTTVTGSGLWVTLNFTAKSAGDNSVATIHLVSPTSYLANSVPDPMPTDLVDGVITIGTPPLPDLTVSNVVATGVPGNLTQYNIAFRVNNIGGANATASSASIVVDGGAPIVIAVPAINAGAFASVGTAAPITLTPTCDNFVITADSAHAIAEGNEFNNTATGSYCYVPASGATTDVNGDIVGTLTFTQPGAAEFGHMALGPNRVTKSMNLLTNQSWTVNVHGNAPNTPPDTGIDGRMTKWSSSPAPAGTYYPYVKLHDAMYVRATLGYLGAPVDPSMTPPSNQEVHLTGADQLLANGIPEGQNPDGTSGETRDVAFDQTIIGSDAALAGGFSYHIVVSFTAATTAW